MNRDCRVTFFQVKNDGEKRERIIRLAEEYFEKKEPLLIRLPHEKALEYVDLLLWRTPQESFLPHAIKDEPCKDFIVLTTTEKNPNSARSVLNLTPQPLPTTFLKIYELEDLASTHKHHSAQERYKAYKAAGCAIITL